MVMTQQQEQQHARVCEQGWRKAPHTASSAADGMCAHHPPLRT
jgi:hypothetical protein